MLIRSAIPVMLLVAIAPAAFAQSADQPNYAESPLVKVSEHVYAVMGFPNCAIVVGDRATLVVDTGLGPRNGAVVMREVEKLAKTPNLYLTTTHYHAEHTAGEQAFPPRTVLIRNLVQQEDMEKSAMPFVQNFMRRSALLNDLLKDVKFRPPDITYRDEINLDLGDVRARLFWLGAAHTDGDELIFIDPDSTLIPGDVVQNKMVPFTFASVKNWIAILNKLEPMKPRFVAPDHGPLGDASLIPRYRAFFTDLQTRALELKRAGKSADEAAQMLTAEFKAKYADWQNMNAAGNAVRRVFAESQ